MLRFIRANEHPVNLLSIQCNDSACGEFHFATSTYVGLVNQRAPQKWSNENVAIATLCVSDTAAAADLFGTSRQRFKMQTRAKHWEEAAANSVHSIAIRFAK